MTSIEKPGNKLNESRIEKYSKAPRNQFTYDEALKRQNYLEKDTLKHEKASPRMQFKEMWVYIFCVLNMTIGLGNIVNFPKSAFKYEVGTFLLVYTIVCLFYIIPIAYLELIMGQYHRGSLLLIVQRCAPIMQGIGWLATISAFFHSIAYQFEVAVQFKYLLNLLLIKDGDNSLKSCNNTWNTGSCYEFFNDKCVEENARLDNGNSHGMYKGKCDVPFEELGSLQSAEIQFSQLINKASQSILELGKFDRGTFMALTILWLSCALLLNRGVYNAAKVVAILMVLGLLFVPALTLSSLKMEGALEGVKQLMTINWQAVMKTDIWIEALQRATLSISVGMGGYVTISSYSPPETHTYKTLMIIVSMDSFMNLMSTATVFATLGFMRHKLGGTSIYDIVPVDDADVITHVILPVLIRGVSDESSLWILTYYLVLTILGWGSVFSPVLSITSTFADQFQISSKTYSFNKIAIALCVIMLACGTFFCFEPGVYWAALFYSISWTLQVLTALLQVLVMTGCYGIDNIYEDIRVLMGRSVPNIFSELGYISHAWKYLWEISPSLTLLVLFSTIYEDIPFMRNTIWFPYFYEMFKFFILFLSVLIIPIFMIVSSLVMKRHVEENEKKQFDSRIMWMKQKQLRSWNRIEMQLQNTIKNEESNSSKERIRQVFENLPEYPPNDLQGNWRLVNRPFFKKRGTKMPVRRENNRKEPRKSYDKAWEKILIGVEKPAPKKKKENKKKLTQFTPTKSVEQSADVQSELQELLVSMIGGKLKPSENTSSAPSPVDSKLGTQVTQTPQTTMAKSVDSTAAVPVIPAANKVQSPLVSEEHLKTIEGKKNKTDTKDGSVDSVESNENKRKTKEKANMVLNETEGGPPISTIDLKDSNLAQTKRIQPLSQITANEPLLVQTQEETVEGKEQQHTQEQ